MDFRSSLVFEFLLHKIPNFHDILSLLFETVFYSNQSSIPELTVVDSRLIELFAYRIWITLTNESKGQRSVISYAVNYGWFLRGFIEITTSAQRACSLKTRDNFHFREALNRVSHSTDLVYVIQINTVFYPRSVFLKRF